MIEKKESPEPINSRSRSPLGLIQTQMQRHGYHMLKETQPWYLRYELTEPVNARSRNDAQGHDGVDGQRTGSPHAANAAETFTYYLSIMLESILNGTDTML